MKKTQTAAIHYIMSASLHNREKKLCMSWKDGFWEHHCQS